MIEIALSRNNVFGLARIKADKDDPTIPIMMLTPLRVPIEMTLFSPLSPSPYWHMLDLRIRCQIPSRRPCTENAVSLVCSRSRSSRKWPRQVMHAIIGKIFLSLEVVGYLAYFLSYLNNLALSFTFPKLANMVILDLLLK